MKCRAVRDGLIDETTYIHAGETFSADPCPSWAVPVETEPETGSEKATKKKGK